MPRSRRPYGKVEQQQLLLKSSSKKNQTDATTVSSEKHQDNVSPRHRSKHNKVNSCASSHGASCSSSFLESSRTSINVRNDPRTGETMRRRQERRRRKAPLRETTNLRSEVSKKRKGDGLLPCTDLSKKKQSPGDEITPRASNCNKIKQQKHSFDETKYYSQYVRSPDNSISPKRNNSDVTFHETVKGRQTEGRGEESENSGMDCSSDSLGIESPNHVEKDNSTNINCNTFSMDASKPTSVTKERILRENQNDKNLTNTDDVKKLYPDSNLVDSNGCPMVSKGLMKRALTSEADDENVLQVLMSSCGGRNRKRAQNKIPSSASSAHSDLTLGSSTLVGATIPLRRCDSFDSTLTFDSYGKYEYSNNDMVEEDSNFQHVTVRRVQKEGMKTVTRPSHPVSEQTKDIPPSGFPSTGQNKTYNSNEKDQCGIVTKSHDLEYHHKTNHTENDDGTVQTIDSGKKSVVIHPKLPPGWRVKVSRSKNQVYYVHPDFGSTWHCPVVTHKPVLIKNYLTPSENRSDTFQKEPVILEYDAKCMPTAVESNQSGEISEMKVVGTEKHDNDTTNHRSHSNLFEKEDIFSNQVDKEIVLSQKQKRKFTIYEDPVIENEPVTDSFEEYETNYDHRDDEKSQSQLPHQARQNDTINNLNTGKNDPSLVQEKETFAKIAASIKKSDCSSINEETSMPQKTAQKSGMRNESMSEESSISNVDNSPRYLDFNDENEFDNFDENNSETSQGHQISAKPSDESTPQQNSGTSQSSSSSFASSSSNVSNSEGNTIHQEEPSHENIQRKRETLAERLARLHHPLCSLQRLDDIIRGKRMGKRPMSYHSRPLQVRISSSSNRWSYCPPSS